MDLDKLAITLRPRSPWEAIDLGFALARRHFIPLCRLWLMSAIPAGLLFLFIADGSLVLMSLLLWWFKPLFEPALMFWLSRAVFGERLPLTSVRRQWWRIVRPQLFANLTWRRFGSNRSFYMPVGLLEGLKGQERRRRIAILGRRQQAGTWLTVVAFHFETILEFSFLLGLYFLVPEELRWFDWDNFLFTPGPIDEWLQLLCWLAAMSLIAPFYVAGGFALYLHRRSELEAWDIEINFRRIAEHATPRARRSTAMAALFCLLLNMAAPEPVQAANSLGPQEAKQQIEQVLADPLFGRLKEQTYWAYVGKEDEDRNSEPPEGLFGVLKFLLKVFTGFLSDIAYYGEIILWAMGLFTVAYLLYHFSRNAKWMQVLSPGRQGERRQRPTQLFGLDVRPDSLPADIVTEALEKLRAGEPRTALSLLYRGALIRLISEHQLDIPASATEGECLQLVQRQRTAHEADYFQQLTRAWQVTAYAHIQPDVQQIEQLCHNWQQVYGYVER